ncbi:MAG: TetR/AcrR family transcriptional regulator C-terminal domain-containing protein [Chloroflexota bacterium]
MPESSRFEPAAHGEPARRRQRRRAPVPLSRERVVAAALRVADADGIDAVSMRRLGQELDVEAMSLYKHVAGKDDILDALVDAVMAEVPVPPADGPWRPAVRQASLDLHAALLRHPWAVPVMESRRNPGPTRLRYLDTIVGLLLGAGFDTLGVGDAFMAIDSLVYGFTIQLLSFPLDLKDDADEAAAMAREVFAVGYPNLVRMAETVSAGPGFAVDLSFGLDLLLDGLERVLEERRAGGGSHRD